MTRLVAGDVFDPDWKPIAGAKLVIPYESAGRHVFLEKDVSGPDGHFGFAVHREEFKDCPDDPMRSFLVAAIAEGYGIAWSEGDQKQVNLSLRLVRDLPLEGRILDLQGKPIVGAKVGLYDIRSYAGGSLTPYLAAVRDGHEPGEEMTMWGGPIPGQPAVATTGPDGRFRMSGIGRDRIVRLQIEGPAIAHQLIWAMTRAADGGGPVREPIGLSPIHGSGFDYVAQPSRPIRGVVRDPAGGKPVAGVELRVFGLAGATTDSEGKFELPGSPKASSHEIEVIPPAGAPFLAFQASIPDTPGLAPLDTQIELRRGIAAKGRVIEAGSGKPAQGHVEYFPLYPNPSIAEFADKFPYARPHSRSGVSPDGAFALATLPGPGVLVFMADSAGSSDSVYMEANVDEADLKKVVKEGKKLGESMLSIAIGGQGVSGLSLVNYQAIALINPGLDAKALEVDLRPEIGFKVVGTVVDPDGKPPSEVHVFGLTTHPFHRQTLHDSRFTVIGLRKAQKRRVTFFDETKGFGMSKEIGADEPRPMIIRLERTGMVVGRLVDQDGRAVVGKLLHCDREGMVGNEKGDRTDREGKFRIEGLVSGQKYRLWYSNAKPNPYELVQIDDGKVRDLGDARIDPQAR